MKKLNILLILFLALISCEEKTNGHSAKINMPDEFISRIHTPEFEIDNYKILGKTYFDKHIADFKKINWKKDFWSEYDSDNFNMSNIEVFNLTDSRYLGISTGINTNENFQFIIGLGTHMEESPSNKPYRKIKLYYSETENEEIPKNIIELFFKKEYSKINIELSKYSMEEIEDLYLNIN
ncbi:hypothetical protein ERX46_10650 [Brumimicrobium glaciale]|uniref:Uncharacterized protein n=1 Tax=Brumimicrobium glaciale TaxID=200475 RepID=A0A4Q4KJE1_9FLAO|nr:hypothetical protein [Brumimicrobium glaciale]RYM33391.1 hypothetical protein ERX46_10650 [Brumimicrobium glaciale]